MIRIATGVRRRRILQITLKSIAERAGVSYQTVWRALHGEGRVSPQTQERIREIAKEMNYRTNRFAAGLRTNRSGIVGLVVLDVSNAFTGALTRAIEFEARARGYSVFLANSDGDIERERDAVLDMIERRIDGLIISGAQMSQSYLFTELPKEFPIVWINKPIARAGLGGVGSRNFDVGLQAVDYFAKRGHQRIGGIFGPFANKPFEARHEGLVEGLARHGLDSNPDWLKVGENTIAFAHQAFMEMWQGEQKPQAVLTTSYRLTEGVLTAVQELGLKRNEDVEVLGFDIQYAEFLQPPMAVFRQQYGEIARRAVERLVAGIEGHAAPEASDVAVPLQSAGR